jgi:hypothetical protein
VRQKIIKPAVTTTIAITIAAHTIFTAYNLVGDYGITSFVKEDKWSLFLKTVQRSRMVKCNLD